MIIIFIFFLIFTSVSASEEIITGSVNLINNPSAGYLRYDANYMVNLDNYGNPIYLDTNSTKKTNMFIHLNNKNILELDLQKMYIYNQNFVLIDSIPYYSTYKIDFHSALVLQNGHYLLLYNETNTVDLSQKVSGAFSNAKVTTNVIIETDRTGTIFWSWKAKDYYEITDVTEDIDLTLEFLRTTHINSLFEDNEGNIIASVRNYDEVIKINKSNGNILWHIGGKKSKYNQYTFVNDTIQGFFGFSHQHSALILSNSNLLLFDNGNLKPNPYSRAVEYQLNHTNKTATKVWEYSNSPKTFTTVMGSVQRYQNGNTLINWGNRINEISTYSQIKFDMTLKYDKTVYRVNRTIAQMDGVSLNIYNKGIYEFKDANFNTNLTLDISTLGEQSLFSSEKHNYTPPSNSKFNDSIFSSLLPYRWVVSANKFSNIKAKLILKLSALKGIINPKKIAFFSRKTETQGAFSHIYSVYDSVSNTLSCNITELGEFCIGNITKTIKPTLIYPSNNQFSIKDTVNLIWNTQYINPNYQLQLSQNPDFSYFDTTLTTINNSTKIINLVKEKIYYWRIRAINNNDTSKWSDVFNFKTELETPRLIYPLNSSKFDRFDTLKWEKNENAIRYILQISTDANFSSFVYNNKSDKNYITLKVLTTDEKYYWRVKCYSYEDSSQWSEVRNFEIPFDKPILKSPLNKSKYYKNNDLNWNPVLNAKNYTVQISIDSTFSNSKIELKTNLLFVSVSNLLFGTNYYWRVTASQDSTKFNWSEVWSFTTNLSIPQNISPGNTLNIDTNNIKFMWDNSDNNVKYKLQISLDSKFSNIFFEQIEIVKSEYTKDFLYSNLTYFWRVSSYNEKDTTDWSSPFSFTTNVKTGLDENQIYSDFITITNDYIEIINNYEKSENIYVIDLSGKLIINKQIESGKKYQLNKTQFSDGIYLIYFKNHVYKIYIF